MDRLAAVTLLLPQQRENCGWSKMRCKNNATGSLRAAHIPVERDDFDAAARLLILNQIEMIDSALRI